MELVHLDRSMVELMQGPVAVRHGETRLDVVLSLHQQIVVTCRDGEFHAAKVLWIDDTEGEPVYYLHVGVRLPMEQAAQRLTDVDMLPENRTMHELLDLLAQLRDDARHPQDR
ncbi:hypothetical protein [Nocardioides sp. Kera G14]|uniref:hypothetical protein n=1 Tax=Nocardioides sp. Kera G14 TaxID=2884264 RepID=UPI001D0F9315|nr:hypothetical protein [Nocardioides sp. Kera G14]UDY23995.1 hypothetical protein LH076_01475 [Nocardioides sp. Kera G14]